MGESILKKWYGFCAIVSVYDNYKTKIYFLFMIMKEGQMLRLSDDELLNLESTYPGIREQIYHFENAALPICSFCGSANTANVQIGVIGRTMAIDAATTKVKLIPNGRNKGSYFCNDCSKYFGEK